MNQKTNFKNNDWLRGGMVGVGVFCVYALYAARDPIFGDGMELVATAAVGGVAHPPGYPTLTSLLAPLSRGEGAYFRATLLCAAFMAVAAGLMRVMVGRLAGRLLPEDGKRAGVVADLLAVALGLSFSFLDAATVVEVYALNALFLAALVLLLAPNPGRPLSVGVLIAASLVQGLAATNHLTSLCMGPLLAWRTFQALLAAPRLTAVLIPSTALAFAIGLSPYLLVPSRAAASPPINWGDPQTMEQIMWMLRGGEYRERQFLRLGPNEFFTLETWVPFAAGRTWDMLRSLGGQFLGGPQAGRPIAGVVVGLLGLGFVAVSGVGFARFWKENRLTASALLLATVLQAAFVLLYNIPDIEDYHLGILITLLPFLVPGVLVLLLEHWPDTAPTLLTPHRHVAVPAVLIAAALVSSTPLYRANIDVGPAWIDRVLEATPPDAMILTHSDYDIYPLWYAQHAEGRRQDVLVVGVNFLRYDWYDRMMPPHRPDDLDRRVAATPGHFTQFTLADHVEAIRRGVIEPNLGRVPVLITNLDGMAIRELMQHYRLVPVAQLMTDEDYTLFVDSPSVPPSVLFEIQSLTPAGSAP